MTDKPTYWFPAKRNGWGWGWPTSWHGRVALGLFFVLIAAGAAVFLPHDEMGAYLAYAVCVTASLIAVCWLKGEPPRWRWGK